jgi:hypothetical protein
MTVYCTTYLEYAANSRLSKRELSVDEQTRAEAVVSALVCEYELIHIISIHYKLITYW